MFLNTLGSTRSCVRPTYICVLSFLSLVLALGLSLDAAAVELPFGAKHEVSLPGIGQPGQGSRQDDVRDSSDDDLSNPDSRAGGGRACSIQLQSLLAVGGDMATTNTWQLRGEVLINDPPLTGELYVRIENGASRVFSAPFEATESFLIDKLYADGSLRSVEAVFSDDPACVATTTVNAPVTSAGFLLNLGYTLPDLSYNDAPLANARETLDMVGPAGAFGTIPSGTFDLDATSANPLRVLSSHAAFCTELSQSISANSTFSDFTVRALETSPSVAGGTSQGQLIPAGGIGRVKAGKVRWLFDNYYQGISISDWTNSQGAAFQAALWDVTHDHYSDNVSQSVIGNIPPNPYRILNDPSGATTLAQSYLTALNALNWSDAQWESYKSRNWHVVYLDSPVTQDQVLGIPLSKSPDLGDLSEPGYPTTTASNGARHDYGPEDAHLGRSRPDSEGDGQPSLDAQGDDAGGGNDEDGVEIWSNWTPNDPAVQTVWFRVTIGSPGFLSLYVDYDSAAPSSLIRATLTDVQGPAAVTTGPFGDVEFSQAGQYLVAIEVPAGQAGATMATRWRITNQAGQGGDSAIGLASTGEIEDFVFENDDTGVPVTLSSFSSSRGKGVIEARWSTSSELGNLGFMLYGEDRQGNWQPLLNELELSPVIDSSSPQSYRISVRDSGIQRLFLEDIDVFGKPTLHGPFAVGDRFGREPQVEAIDWERIRRANAIHSRASLEPRVGLPAVPVRLLIEREGIHRISYSELADAGLISAPIELQNLELKHAGEPVPMRLIGAGRRLEPGAEIEFLGRAVDGEYARAAVYTLGVVYSNGDPISDSRATDRIGSAAATTISASSSRRASSSRPETSLTTGRAQMVQKRDRVYSASSVASTPWSDTRMVVQANPRSWNFNVDLDGLAAVGSSQLEIYLAGVTDYPDVDLDHRVEVSLNGIELESIRLAGREARRFVIPLTDGLLRARGNQLTLRMPADTGAPASVVSLVEFAIDYPRELMLDGEALRFDAAAGSIRVDGLQVPGVSVHRLVNGRAEWVDGVRVGKGSGSRYSALIPGDRQPATYFVASDDQVLRPALEPGRTPVSIADGRSDYLMISHPDFIDGLEPLIDFHTQRGLVVRVIDVRDVYAQYGDGQADPAAIADYLAAAAPRMGLRYVLLVGGDTWDYRNTAGTDSISFIPSLYARTSDLVQFAPSDSLLADLDGDRVQDLAIGRFPVRTLDELSAIIDKTLAYVQRDYQQSLVLSADRQEPGLSFTDQSEQFIGELDGDWWLTRAYLDELSVGDARNRLMGGINAGANLTSFFGHSAYSVWSFEGLFESSDVGLLSNAGRPTAVVQFGCWNTYHVVPSYSTLGHAWMLTPDLGAALVMGSSTFTQVTSSRQFADVLIPELLRPGQSAGQAVVAAKQRLAASHPQALDMLLGWTILGDPAIELGSR